MASTQANVTLAARLPARQQRRLMSQRRRTGPSRRLAITSCFSSTTTALPPKESGFASLHEEAKMSIITVIFFCSLSYDSGYEFQKALLPAPRERALRSG